MELTGREKAILKGLLVQLLANQVNMNAQSVVDNAQNCIYFMGLIDKVPEIKVEEVVEEI